MKIVKKTERWTVFLYYCDKLQSHVSLEKKKTDKTWRVNEEQKCT